MKKSITILLILITLLTTISACGEKEKQTEDLAIGVLAPLSGMGSEALARGSFAAQVAVDWINDNGGIDIGDTNYQIKLLVEDMKMTPEGLIAATNKLIYDDQVKFILNLCPVAAFRDAISPITESNKVLRVDSTGQGMENEINAGTPYTFVTTVDKTIYNDYFLDYYLDMFPGIKNVAMIMAEDPSCIYIMENYIPLLEERGLNIVAFETYPFGTTDFYPMWTKILDANPDAIVSGAGFPEWFGGIVKQGRELGFDGPMYFPTQGADPYIVEGIAGAAATTKILATSYDFQSDEMTPMIKEMAGMIKESLGRDITYDDLSGWETAWILIQAIEEAQSIDPTEVRDTFEKMESIETPNGTGKMGGQETFGINHILVRPWPLLSITDGVIKHEAWFTPDIP